MILNRKGLPGESVGEKGLKILSFPSSMVFYSNLIKKSLNWRGYGQAFDPGNCSSY